MPETWADWNDGQCEKCGRESQITSVEHPDHDALCLVCLDGFVESGEIEPATGGTP